METITMWAELSANVPNARNMRPSSTTSKTVTISPDDVAKIRKDAKNTISFNLSLFTLLQFHNRDSGAAELHVFVMKVLDKRHSAQVLAY